jgi:hypothetical protein
LLWDGFQWVTKSKAMFENPLFLQDTGLSLKAKEEEEK